MTVQELIEELQKIEDKSKEVMDSQGERIIYVQSDNMLVELLDFVPEKE